MNESVIKPTSTVRNLSVVFESKASMKACVSVTLPSAEKKHIKTYGLFNFVSTRKHLLQLHMHLSILGKMQETDFYMVLRNVNFNAYKEHKPL